MMLSHTRLREPFIGPRGERERPFCFTGNSRMVFIFYFESESADRSTGISRGIAALDFFCSMRLWGGCLVYVVGFVVLFIYLFFVSFLCWESGVLEYIGK